MHVGIQGNVLQGYRYNFTGTLPKGDKSHFRNPDRVIHHSSNRGGCRCGCRQKRIDIMGRDTIFIRDLFSIIVLTK